MKTLMVLCITLILSGCATVTKDLARTLRYSYRQAMQTGLWYFPANKNCTVVYGDSAI